MHLTRVVRLGTLSLGTMAVLGLTVFVANGGPYGSVSIASASAAEPKNVMVLVGAGQEPAAGLFVAPILSVEAQAAGCPIASDSTVSQAVGSPMSGNLDA